MSHNHDGMPQLRPGDRPEMRSPAYRFRPELPLTELFEEFLVDSASIINSATEKTYKYDWRYFEAWLMESRVPPVLGSLTRELLVAYIAAQQRRPKCKGPGTLSSHSVHKYTRIVRTFNRWLVSRDYFPTDLLAGAAVTGPKLRSRSRAPAYICRIPGPPFRQRLALWGSPACQPKTPAWDLLSGPGGFLLVSRAV